MNTVHWKTIQQLPWSAQCHRFIEVVAGIWEGWALPDRGEGRQMFLGHQQSWTNSHQQCQSCQPTLSRQPKSHSKISQQRFFSKSWYRDSWEIHYMAKEAHSSHFYYCNTIIITSTIIFTARETGESLKRNPAKWTQQSWLTEHSQCTTQRGNQLRLTAILNMLSTVRLAAQCS